MTRRLTPAQRDALRVLAAANETPGSPAVETANYTTSTTRAGVIAVVNGNTAAALVRHGLAEETTHPLYPWSSRRYVRITNDGLAALQEQR